MTEYFVSINGNDSNNGLFPATPWRHLQYATNHLVAGDTLHIMDGTYQETITGVNSGVVGNPITFTNYNGGAPVIDGSWMTTKNGGLISFLGKQNIRITNLKIANSSAYGLFFPSAGTSGITIDNCEIYGHSLSGIYFYPPNPNFITNVLIENNIIHDCQNWWNHLPGIGPNETITISNVDGFILRNNRLYFNHKLPVDIKNNSRNGQVYGNIISTYASPNYSTHGFYVDGYDDHAMDIDLFNNIVYGPDGGFTIGAEQGGRLTRIRLFNNIYYGTGHAFQINNHWKTVASSCVDVSCSGPITNCCGTPGVDHLKTDCSIINNTVYATGPNGIGLKITDRTESFPPNNFIIRNNIFNATVGLATGSGNIDWTKLIIDHNLFNSTSSVYWGANSIRANPLFIDPANNNFHLQPTSPCINTGNNLNAPMRDFDLFLRGPQVDIGAYEYAGTNQIDDYMTFIINVR